MAKRKKSPVSNNDTKVAAIVLGLFVAAIILFFILLKAKEPHKAITPPPSEAEEAYIPNENIKPAELMPVRHINLETFKGISGSGGKIAIIIDDWGQTTANCKYLQEIPEPMAVSILPGLRHTRDVANCAKLYHKLTMLHLPLEAFQNFDFYYPPDYIIKTTMKSALVSKILDDDLAQLPSIEGVNNHMGSKATADRALMRIIFRKLRGKGLFFVDSMTSRYSVSAELADEMGLAYGKRDVFLDNINTREAITKQLMILAQKARRRGYAVAIGHDRHLTMQVIKDEIPWLEKQGFKIVSIKQLLKHK
jgi:polysaccharide deacetylase 2 family uncharacterized protein YibQ